MKERESERERENKRESERYKERKGRGDEKRGTDSDQKTFRQNLGQEHQRKDK